MVLAGVLVYKQHRKNKTLVLLSCGCHRFLKSLVQALLQVDSFLFFQSTQFVPCGKAWAGSLVCDQIIDLHDAWQKRNQIMFLVLWIGLPLMLGESWMLWQSLEMHLWKPLSIPYNSVASTSWDGSTCSLQWPIWLAVCLINFIGMRHWPQQSECWCGHWWLLPCNPSQCLYGSF